MSQLVKKSKENIAAAKILSKFELFAPSIHCSYYSSVQLSIEIVVNYFGVKETDIIQRAKTQKGGTHVYTSNLITIDLEEKNWKSAREYNAKIEGMRRKREHSDYRDIKMSPDDAKSVYEDALIVNELLTKSYSIPD